MHQSTNLKKDIIQQSSFFSVSKFSIISIIIIAKFSLIFHYYLKYLVSSYSVSLPIFYIFPIFNHFPNFSFFPIFSIFPKFTISPIFPLYAKFFKKSFWFKKMLNMKNFDSKKILGSKKILCLEIFLLFFLLFL